jgi:hypothetical protein
VAAVLISIVAILASSWVTIAVSTP